MTTVQVPREPTYEMLTAGANECDPPRTAAAIRVPLPAIYRAMLAAAPAVAAEPVNRQMLEALRLIQHATAPTPDDGGGHEAAYEIASAAIAAAETQPAGAALGAQPTPEKISEIKRLGEAWVLQAILRERGNQTDAADKARDAFCAALDALVKEKS